MLECDFIDHWFRYLDCTNNNTTHGRLIHMRNVDHTVEKCVVDRDYYTLLMFSSTCKLYHSRLESLCSNSNIIMELGIPKDGFEVCESCKYLYRGSHCAICHMEYTRDYVWDKKIHIISSWFNTTVTIYGQSLLNIFYEEAGESGLYLEPDDGFEVLYGDMVMIMTRNYNKILTFIYIGLISPQGRTTIMKWSARQGFSSRHPRFTELTEKIADLRNRPVEWDFWK